MNTNKDWYMKAKIVSLPGSVYIYVIENNYEIGVIKTNWYQIDSF